MGCGMSTDGAASNQHNNPNAGVAKALRKYLKLEQAIRLRESRNPWQKMRLNFLTLADVEKDIRAKSLELAEMQQKTHSLEIPTFRMINALQVTIPHSCSLIQFYNRGHTEADLVSLEGILKAETQGNADQDKIDALTRQILLTSELGSLEAQKAQLSSEIKSLEAEAEELQNLYSKQDTVLDAVFGGEYGSMKENQLEQEWEIFDKRREQVTDVLSRWTQARSNMVTAFLKITSASESNSSDRNESEQKRADARNDLTTAANSFQAARRNLGNVDTRYCSDEVIDALQTAAADAFKDGDSNNSQTDSFYSEMMRNAASFAVWIDEVIKTRILPHHEAESKKAKEAEVALRAERIHLLKKKAIMEEVGVEYSEENTEMNQRISEDGTPNSSDEEDAMTINSDALRSRADPDVGPIPSIQDILGKYPFQCRNRYLDL
ncbi:unnamed protein product [Notodromas monacha]|uniref:Uncharacterized protein n=1 Tax=Notodromas monacha TaxID=399045 RepID=A0A7R9BZ18_9CRUS|nr:unnamed protein product [Notodromas monacha]CAG0923976.1 unnamed protein product [Notodromas monacha]